VKSLNKVIENLQNNIDRYTAIFDDPASDDKQFIMAREQRYVCQTILDAIEAGRIVR
jgi:hypothetical protein